MKQNQHKYKMDTAVAMWKADFSLKNIQKELGSDITVMTILKWVERCKDNRCRQIEQNYPFMKCGNGFCQKEASVDFGGIMYCSRCYKKQKKKAIHGARDRNKRKKKKTSASWKKRVFASWKDTPEQAAIRRSPEYQEWRRIVLERDRYTCQHCEKTGGRLVVHHIKTFKMHEDLRMNPDNGIVLCTDCHEALHLSRTKKLKVLRIA